MSLGEDVSERAGNEKTDLASGRRADLGARHLEIIRETIAKLGAYAEGLFDYHDFGFPRAFVGMHISRVENRLARMRDEPHVLPPELGAFQGRRGTVGIWEYGQSLRYAAGASLIAERFHRWLAPDRTRTALIAKVLYEWETDLLDDLVDHGTYTQVEASELYRHCLELMTAPTFDDAVFARDLERILGLKGQREFVGLMTEIVTALHRLLRDAPQMPTIGPEIARQNEWLAEGQGLTMSLKRPNVNIDAVRRAAKELWAPDPDVSWHERLTKCVTHTTNLSLIDLAFAERPIGPEEIQAHVNAWYYYDVVVSHLNNLDDVNKDLAAGIANLAALAMHDVDTFEELLESAGRLTMTDYEAHFARIAEMCRRAMRFARAGYGDAELFDPFISIMIPVVMMAGHIGEDEDEIHSYLCALAPQVRKAVADRLPSSDVPVTIPQRARSGPSPSARTASS